jgi:catechol 2,3-dioxygenase-like lactoylglutathione lyase family enzyme
MRIHFTSLFVGDQAAAHRFYTEVLGFQTKSDIPVGEEHRWLTVVSPEDPDGPELVLEPGDHPAVAPFKDALLADGIPFTALVVDDVEAEAARLRGHGVQFTQEPLDAGPVVTAVIADGFGNLLQLVEVKPVPAEAVPEPATA